MVWPRLPFSLNSPLAVPPPSALSYPGLHRKCSFIRVSVRHNASHPTLSPTKITFSDPQEEEAPPVIACSPLHVSMVTSHWSWLLPGLQSPLHPEPCESRAVSTFFTTESQRPGNPCNGNTFLPWRPRPHKSFLFPVQEQPGAVCPATLAFIRTCLPSNPQRSLHRGDI